MGILPEDAPALATLVSNADQFNSISAYFIANTNKNYILKVATTEIQPNVD